MTAGQGTKRSLRRRIIIVFVGAASVNCSLQIGQESMFGLEHCFLPGRKRHGTEGKCYVKMLSVVQLVIVAKKMEVDVSNKDMCVAITTRIFPLVHDTQHSLSELSISPS